MMIIKQQHDNDMEKKKRGNVVNFNDNNCSLYYIVVVFSLAIFSLSL